MLRSGDPDGQNSLAPGKPLALVAYLSLAVGCSAPRDVLTDLLWSDAETDAAKHALRQTVWYLRKRFGENIIITRGNDLAIGTSIDVDRDRFLAAVEARDLEEACRLYKGDFLPNFAVPGGVEFEHWADLERQRLRAVFARSATSLVQSYLSSARHREALALARRVRDIDILDESGWRLLLEVLSSSNDRIGAASEADRLEQILRDEQREPEPATRSAIRLARTTSSSVAEPTRVNDEAVLVSELVGRDKEFSAILAAWSRARQGTSQIVHVFGAAGIGKSRLIGDVIARLRATKSRVAVCRANPGERDVSFALVSSIVESLVVLPGAAAISEGSASALVTLNPRLTSHYPGASVDSGPEVELIRRRALALHELLESVCDETPIALIIDDLHWADEPSKQVLLSVAGRLAQERVLLVCASRNSSGLASATGSFSLLELQPLGDSDVQEFLSSIASFSDTSWMEQLATALRASTRGSPLLLLETLTLLRERGELVIDEQGWSSPDRPALDQALKKGDALEQRLRRLHESHASILLHLAIAGSPLTSAILSRSFSGGNVDLQTPLLDMERRGMVVRSANEWSPAHDEIAAGIQAITREPELLQARIAVARALLAFPSESRLRQAMQLLPVGNQSRQAAFAEFVRLRRSQGDRRSTRQLAGDFAGGAADLSFVTRGVPLMQRYKNQALIGAAAALALMVSGRLVARASQHDAPDEYLVAATLDSTERGWSGQLAITPALLSRSDPIQLNTGEPPTPWLREFLHRHEGWQLSPDNHSILYDAVTRDSGGIELFVVSDDGARRRLTYSPGDDGSANWSPDGKLIVFSSGRWDRIDSHSNLGLLDLRTLQVRRLTKTSQTDAAPKWSPDGSRIAFFRRHFDMLPNEVCWITVDGSIERCMSLPDAENAEVYGWLNPEQVLIGQMSDGQVHLSRIDVRTQQMTAGALLEGTRLRVSPDMQWLVCYCASGGKDGRSWDLRPVDHPETRRPLRVPREAADVVVHWLPGPTVRRTYVSKLLIFGPAADVPIDGSARLHAAGITPAGDTLVALAVNWRSADSSIGTVDASGLFRPHRFGTTWVYATNGGWQRDSLLLHVGVSATRELLRETWTRGISADWKAFGMPRPSVAEGPGGIASLSNNGEGSFVSGVYSARAYDMRAGLGLEFRASVPLTRSQWQVIVVSLGRNLDEPRLKSWDHATGPIPEATRLACELALPAGEGYGLASKADLRTPRGTGAEKLGPQFWDGSWHTYRLQIFPDGRCGFAIDGTPHILLDGRIALDQPGRVTLRGNSLGTRVLVGPLTLWQGVRSDIDWTVLDTVNARK